MRKCPNEALLLQVILPLHHDMQKERTCRGANSEMAIRGCAMFVQDALKCQDAVRAYSQCAQRVFAG